MRLISEIVIERKQGDGVIQLLQGDMSAISPEYASDILAMSAFPNDYKALEGSLVYALAQKGFSVEAIAKEKEADLREQLNCWLSKPLPKKDQEQFNFKKILCFEPGEKIKEPDNIVGNIFRCINTFVFNDTHNTVIMPMIGTGYQQVSLEKILPALLKAATFWLQNGLPLQCLRLVTHSDEQCKKAMALFEKFKDEIKPGKEKAPPKPAAAPQPSENISGGPETNAGYDYFLSYAHKHAADVQYFVDKLKHKNSSLSIFYDKDSIPPGGLWIQQISVAIASAKKVLVFLSPDYDNSPVCWDEFQCAKLVEYNQKKSVIQTVYLYGHTENPMPLIMGIYSYIDCREGSKEKIDACIEKLLKQ